MVNSVIFVIIICIDFQNNIVLPAPPTIKDIVVARVVKYIAEVIYLLRSGALCRLLLHSIKRCQVKYNRFPCRILRTFVRVVTESFSM